MAKPTALTADLMTTPPAAPQAGLPPRGFANQVAPEAPKPEIVPFQIRIPKADRFAIKIAAAEQHFTTESEFMLACFHFYMQHNAVKGEA